MRAMVLRQQGRPLELEVWPLPQVKPGHVLIKASACGVCRTDLHVVDGDLKEPVLPLTPGYQPNRRKHWIRRFCLHRRANSFRWL